jgi:AcrR family transcriptional regulator
VRQPVAGKTEAGRRRESRARQTRQRIIAAGLQLFLDRGYVATTVEAIARQAGVAPATVYQAFGTKQAILAAALDATIAGDDEPLAVLDRDWVSQARRQHDPIRQLRLVVSGACQVAARTTPLKQVMRDAAAFEPAVRDLVRQDHERRRLTQQRLVQLLAERRPLRAGLDLRHAVDTFFAVVNSGTYELLVGYCGWSELQWQDWLIDLIEREFFGEPSNSAIAPEGHRPPAPNNPRI